MLQEMEHGMRDNIEMNRTGRQRERRQHDDIRRRREEEEEEEQAHKRNWRLCGKLVASIPVLVSPTSTTVVAYLPVAFCDKPCCDLHRPRLH